MGLLATTIGVDDGATSLFFNFPFKLPMEISAVPSWPTVVYVLPSEKLANGITFRFSVPAPAPNGTGFIDVGVVDST